MKEFLLYTVQIIMLVIVGIGVYDFVQGSKLNARITQVEANNIKLITTIHELQSKQIEDSIMIENLRGSFKIAFGAITCQDKYISCQSTYKVCRARYKDCLTTIFN